MIRSVFGCAQRLSATLMGSRDGTARCGARESCAQRLSATLMGSPPVLQRLTAHGLPHHPFMHVGHVFPMSPSRRARSRDNPPHSPHFQAIMHLDRLPNNATPDRSISSGRIAPSPGERAEELDPPKSEDIALWWSVGPRDTDRHYESLQPCPRSADTTASTAHCRPDRVFW